MISLAIVGCVGFGIVAAVLGFKLGKDVYFELAEKYKKESLEWKTIAEANLEVGQRLNDMLQQERIKLETVDKIFRGEIPTTPEQKNIAQQWFDKYFSMISFGKDKQ